MKKILIVEVVQEEVYAFVWLKVGKVFHLGNYELFTLGEDYAHLQTKQWSLANRRW